MAEAKAAIADGLKALQLVAITSWKRLVAGWVWIPVGLFAVMAVCFGVDRLISLSHIAFPASVACMILLFLTLIVCEVVLGDKKTKRLVTLIEIPCGFALRYINIFFCPAFVTLPLSPSISGPEVAKIIVVFVIGYATMFTFTACMTRVLQKVLGTSKRAVTERAEEMGNENDDIPMTEPLPDATTSSSGTGGGVDTSATPASPDIGLSESMVPLLAPMPAQDPTLVTGTGGPPVPMADGTSIGGSFRLRHDPLALSRSQVWATALSGNLDMVIYFFLLITVGLPVYYAANYAMPLQLSINVICFLLALRIPVRYKTYLHPVLVSAVFTIVSLWVFALIHRSTLKVALEAYSTKTTYIKLWDRDLGVAPPGAGDIFSSVLDVSIVALGLPMFQYRQELKSRFLSIIIPNVSLSIGSLFAYPIICHAIGISGSRSLAFANRSLTLALATPATQNLGGDLFTVAPLCIFSGIIGVIVGPWALNILRIPDDDYITRGVTLGANSSAVATALLLTTDPRAAAFSSLSMGLFGTITVALTSVPPLVTIIRGLVGL